MSRPVRRHAVQISLFPFLAVLICIMGALVVVLVLMVIRIDNDVKTAAAYHSAAAADDTATKQKIEDAQWRREMLEQSRGEKTAELAAARDRLAHLEEHTLRLAARARELMERAKGIDEGKQLRGDEISAAKTELVRVQSEITRKEAELDEAKKKAAGAEKWYALIPYEGPHSTRRRPIYVECTERGVILQPEGLVLTPDDFNGPLGPQNPLDAALRTVREYITRTAGKSAGEPYPLLVVRPSGVIAYGAARAALKSWDEEFGYELVGEEKKLVFGSPDPALAGILEKAVAVARQRQAAMVAMMPRRYQPDEGLQSFAISDSPGGAGGGTGSGVGGGRAGGVGSAPGGGASGGNAAGGGGLGGNGSRQRSAGSGRRGGMTGPIAGTAPGGGDSFAGGAGNFVGGTGATYGGAPGSGSGTGAGAGGGSGAGGSGAGGGSGNGGGYAGAGGGSGAPRGAAAGGYALPGGVPGGYAPAGSTSGVGSPSGPYGAGGSSGGGSPTGGMPAGGIPSRLPGGGFANSSADPTSDPTNPYGNAQSGLPSANLDFGQSPPRTRVGQSGQPGQPGGDTPGGRGDSKQGTAATVARGRGNNWAIPAAQRHATAITRPIRVAILADRLVLVPDAADQRPPQHVRISDEMTAQEVDAFVAAVQREMRSWGLAVQNGYWKPIIDAEIATDAEHHFASLQTALEGSGFQLQRNVR